MILCSIVGFFFPARVCKWLLWRDLNESFWGKICETSKRTEPEVSLAINSSEVRISNILLILKFCCNTWLMNDKKKNSLKETKEKWQLNAWSLIQFPKLRKKKFNHKGYYWNNLEILNMDCTVNTITFILNFLSMRVII